MNDRKSILFLGVKILVNFVIFSILHQFLNIQKKRIDQNYTKNSKESSKNFLKKILFAEYQNLPQI